MATSKNESPPNDEDDIGELDEGERIQQTKVSPWILTKAHLKVTAGKKTTNKSSKRGAGGKKAKKKGAVRAWPTASEVVGAGAGSQSSTLPADSESDDVNKTGDQNDDIDQKFLPAIEEYVTVTLRIHMLQFTVLACRPLSLFIR